MTRGHAKSGLDPFTARHENSGVDRSTADGRLDEAPALRTWIMGGMEVLGSRVLLRPTELARSHRFYRDMLGLAIHREFGSQDAPGLVFFLGNGLLEVSGRATEAPGDAIALWIQVRDIRDEHRRLVGAGVTVLRGAATRGVGLGGDVDRGPGRSTHRLGRDSEGSSTPQGPTPPGRWRRMSRPAG